MELIKKIVIQKLIFARTGIYLNAILCKNVSVLITAVIKNMIVWTARTKDKIAVYAYKLFLVNKNYIKTIKVKDMQGGNLELICNSNKKKP
ncbi:hypothetical protein HZS_8071 [Henneguya salminicola]|nr:hypothetical protein HZS_8071 [Henneguya salminicola]